MTDMKLVPKPEGFDFRDKKSDKSNKGDDWKAQDALYDVSKHIAENLSKENLECSSLIVVWREKDKEGRYHTHFRYSGGEYGDNGAGLLACGLGKFMGWDR